MVGSASTPTGARRRMARFAPGNFAESRAANYPGERRTGNFCLALLSSRQVFSAMRFSEKIAFLITERRGLMWSAVVLVALSSVAILVMFLRLDTEVLDLLPR